MPDHHIRRIAMAVGDTAGHVYPALAVALAFRQRFPETRVLFLGTPDSMAAGILAREGERLVPVPGAPLRRVGPGGIALSVLRTSQGVIAAREVLRSHGARLVLGFGGFASGGILIAARSLGLRTAIHEANVEPGLANSWLGRIVHRAYVAHRDIRLADAIDVGMPIRPSIAALASRRRDAPEGTMRVLVTTGSRGAPFFARAIPEVLAAVARTGSRIDVLQQVPEEAVPALKHDYESAGICARAVPFIEDMPGAYAWAHVAIARAGASTIAELATVGLPALLVPLSDAAAGHQAPNARRWSTAGAGPTILEHSWDSTVAKEWLRAMATDARRWREASDNARHLAQPDAPRRIVDDCEHLVHGRW